MTETWVDRVTADDLLSIIHAALGDGDMKAAAAAIRLLAVKDPDAAETILAVLDSARSQRPAHSNGGTDA